MPTPPAPKLLILLLALLAGGGLLAATAPAENKQYDYVTVVFAGRTSVNITYGPDRFEEKKVEQKGSKDNSNFTPLLAEIRTLEAQGYELVENQFQPSTQTSTATNYVLLRKPR
jgi:hypothetical protein